MKMKNGKRGWGSVEAGQEDVEITVEMVTARSKKIPNWRAPVVICCNPLPRTISQGEYPA